MSTRAYREIVAPVLAKNASFNLTHDEHLYNSLLELDDSWICESEYHFEIAVTALEEFLGSEAASAYEPEVLAPLFDDLEATRKAGEECITYHCF